jgi:hypothetical protein
VLVSAYVPIPSAPIRHDAMVLAWVRRYAFAFATAIAGVVLAYVAAIFWLWDEFDLSAFDGMPSDNATESMVWPIAITVFAIVMLAVSAVAWRRALEHNGRRS